MKNKTKPKHDIQCVSQRLGVGNRFKYAFCTVRMPLADFNLKIKEWKKTSQKWHGNRDKIVTVYRAVNVLYAPRIVTFAQYTQPWLLNNALADRQMCLIIIFFFCFCRICGLLLTWKKNDDHVSLSPITELTRSSHLPLQTYNFTEKPQVPHIHLI